MLIFRRPTPTGGKAPVIVPTCFGRAVSTCRAVFLGGAFVFVSLCLQWPPAASGQSPPRLCQGALNDATNFRTQLAFTEPEAGTVSTGEPLLTWAFQGSPRTLDPQQAGTLVELQVARDLYEGLLTVGPDWKLYQGVAQAVTMERVARRRDDSPEIRHRYRVDGCVLYTFHLHKNQMWSGGDGRPVTAGDFEFAIQRVRAQQAPTWLRSWFGLIVLVTALDPYTLLVIEDAGDPIPDLLRLMAHPGSAPLPAAYVRCELPDKNRPCGEDALKRGQLPSNGAFKLLEYLPDDRILLERNPAYERRRAARFERVLFRVVPDVAARAAMFLTQQADIAVDLRGEDVAEIRRVGRIGDVATDLLPTSCALMLKEAAPSMTDALSGVLRASTGELSPTRERLGRLVPGGPSTKESLPSGKVTPGKPSFPDDLGSGRGLRGGPPVIQLFAFQFRRREADVAEVLRGAWSKDLPRVRVTAVESEGRDWPRDVSRDTVVARFTCAYSALGFAVTYLRSFVTEHIETLKPVLSRLQDSLARIDEAARIPGMEGRREALMKEEEVLLRGGWFVPVYQPRVIVGLRKGLEGWQKNPMGVHESRVLRLRRVP